MSYSCVKKRYQNSPHTNTILRIQLMRILEECSIVLYDLCQITHSMRHHKRLRSFL